MSRVMEYVFEMLVFWKVESLKWMVAPRLLNCSGKCGFGLMV